MRELSYGQSRLCGKDHTVGTDSLTLLGLALLAGEGTKWAGMAGNCRRGVVFVDSVGLCLCGASELMFKIKQFLWSVWGQGAANTMMASFY